jgi:serine/threonine protein kinase
VRDHFKPRFAIILTRVQSNILLDASNHARITDFGLTKVTRNLDSIRSASSDQDHVGRWTAPEILNEEGTYSMEGDVFSFAMVMIEARYEWAICRVLAYCHFSSPQVFTGAVPFSSSLSPTAMLAIMDGRRPPRPTHPALTDQLWAYVQRCWDQDSHSRPEASEVLKVLRVSVSFHRSHIR